MGLHTAGKVGGRSADWATYRRIVPLLRPYRVVLGAALTAALLRPMLAAGRIWLLKVLIDGALGGHDVALLALVAGGFVASAVARGLLLLAEQSLAGRAGTGMVRDLRVRVYQRLQSMSLRYFHGQKLGDLLTRLSGDIGAIQQLLVSGFTALVGHCVTIVVFLVLCCALDPLLLVVALATVPLVVAAAVIEARLGRRAQREIREASSDLTAIAEEHLSAIALVKAFARGQHEIRRFAGAAERSAAAARHGIRVWALFSPAADLVAALGTGAVIWIGGRQVLAGQISVGSLVIFISYLGSLYGPITGLGRMVATTQKAMVGATRVVEILDAPEELAERAHGPDLPRGPGTVVFDRVRFGYRPDAAPVLQDVSFTADPGEVVAIIGPSGAGKTTLVALLLSYYDPDSGAILLGSHPLKDHNPDSNRRAVAAVLQEPMLFDTTIAENIRYGNLDATEDDIIVAARMAEADEFITALPEGYETVVGPRGAALSGGQRQRVAIARALVKRAPVLVLDEATSALDPATEERVLANLRTAATTRTVLMVTHRLAGIRCADRVIKLEGGRIVAQGRPEDVGGVGRTVPITA